MRSLLTPWRAGLVAAFLLGHASVSRAQLMEVPLVAGQNTVVGTVTAAVLETTLLAIITTQEDWEMDLVHLAIAQSLDGIPRTISGNPQIGRFPHQFVGGPGVQSFFIELALDFVPDPQQQLVLAIHSEVVRASERGNVYCDRCAGEDDHCRGRDGDDDDDDDDRYGGRHGGKGDDCDRREKGDDDRKHSSRKSKGSKSKSGKDDCDRRDKDDHDDKRSSVGGKSSKNGKDVDCDRRNKGGDDRNSRDDDDDDDGCSRRGDRDDDDDDCVCRKAGETAWAYGLPFGGGSWAMYMSFYPFDGSDN